MWYTNLSVIAQGKNYQFDEFSFQSELGLFSEGDGDLLETVLKEANLGDLDADIDLIQPQQKTNTTHTDHDYFTQRSPTHSDSGVSLESSAYSPMSFSDDQQLRNSPTDNYLSESPPNFTNDFMERLSDHSPLGLEDLDMKDFDLEGVEDASALMSEQDFLNYVGNTSSSTSNDKEAVTISFGKCADKVAVLVHSALCSSSTKYKKKM